MYLSELKNYMVETVRKIKMQDRSLAILTLLVAWNEKLQEKFKSENFFPFRHSFTFDNLLIKASVVTTNITTRKSSNFTITIGRFY